MKTFFVSLNYHKYLWEPWTHQRHFSTKKLLSMKSLLCCRPTVWNSTAIPGGGNSLQLEKTIGSHHCWQTAVYMCTQKDFLTAEGCSPVRKDGFVSRDTRREKLSSAYPAINRARRKPSSAELGHPRDPEKKLSNDCHGISKTRTKGTWPWACKTEVN